MINIKQIIDGKVVYKADVESYNYSVPQFIQNGAVKITIKYPILTMIVTPKNQEAHR
jgi:hypothetical protein